MTNVSPKTSVASQVRRNIAELSGYAPGEQPQGGKWIKLNTNENPYPPSPAVHRALIATASGSSLAKYPDPLATAFRMRAADAFRVSPEMIISGNGSDDILTMLIRTFVGEGECLRTPSPSYILYSTLAEIQNAVHEAFTFNADWSLSDDFANPDTKDGTPLKLAIIANPNSPSGTVLSPPRILELAEQLSCPLVVDEAYADFAESNCMDLVTKNKRIIVTRSLSKSYALAGLRFGFAVAHPSIIEQMQKVKDSYNCDTLSIAAATAAIDDHDWLANNRKKILSTRHRLVANMQNMGFDVTDSQANFVWCTHPQRPLKPIFETLKQHGVLIRYMQYADWGDGLRITVGTDEEIDVFVDIMKTL